MPQEHAAVSSVQVRVLNQAWTLKVSLPRRWARKAFVDDLIQVVVNKREATSAALVRRGYTNVWLPSRCAQVRLVDAPLRKMPLLAWLADKNCVDIIERADWRSRHGIPTWLPGDAIREILRYAGGTMVMYRCLCRRLRDESSVLIRRVIVKDNWWACRRAFPHAEIVFVRPPNVLFALNEVLHALHSWTNLIALCLNKNTALVTQLLHKLPLVVPRLRALDLSECDLSNHLVTTLASLSELQALDLSDCSNFEMRDLSTEDSFLDLALSHLSSWPNTHASKKKNTHSRRVLALSKSRNIDTSALVRDYPGLRTLRLVDCGLQDSDLLALRYLRSLDHDLDLSHNAHISDAGIQLLFHTGNTHPRPISLNLRKCDALTDTALDMIAASTLALKDLDLEMCWRLTADGIRTLATNMPTLRRLYLRGAASVLRRAVRDDLMVQRANNASRSLIVHFGSRFRPLDSRDARRGNHSPLAHWFGSDASFAANAASSAENVVGQFTSNKKAAHRGANFFDEDDDIHVNNDDSSSSSSSGDDDDTLLTDLNDGNHNAVSIAEQGR